MPPLIMVILCIFIFSGIFMTISCIFNRYKGFFAAFCVFILAAAIRIMPLENVFIVIAILLLAAKIFGEIAERMGTASLVGEIFGGVLVGPILGLVAINSFVDGLFTISIVFLLFLAGLEIKFEDIKHHIYSAGVLAFFGGVLSFFFGMLVGLIFFNNIMIGFAIGIVLISTSNGTLFLFLMKTGQFNSKVGKLIIAITIADDIVGIIFLSVFSAFIKSNSFAVGSAMSLFFVSIGLYLVVFTAGSKIANAVLDFTSRFIDSTIFLAMPIAITFLLAFVTENIGVSIATGAFLGGMAIANSRYSGSVILPNTEIAAKGFFVPIFYAGVGALLVFSDLNVLLILSILLAAILGKIVGIGFLSKFFGVQKRDRSLLGIIMIPRGNENIAIVQIVFLLGVITYQVYTSIVFAIVATIIITSILLKISFKKV